MGKKNNTKLLRRLDIENLYYFPTMGKRNNTDPLLLGMLISAYFI